MTTSTPKTKDPNEKSRNSQFRMVSLKLCLAGYTQSSVPGELNQFDIDYIISIFMAIFDVGLVRYNWYPSILIIPKM